MMMWWGDDIVEFLRGGVVLMAFLVVVSPLNVGAATEFTVHRLQQYQLHGYSYGSLGSVVGVEAGTISNGPMLRQCILAKLSEVTPSVYQRVAESAAAMVIILPGNMTALAPPARQLVRELEQSMLNQEVQMAVFFAQENAELNSIYNSVKKRTKTATKSAAANFFSSLASDGYQMVVSGAQSKPVQDLAIANIQGKLSGYGAEDKLPTVALVAHYDTFAAAPELAFGGDSNGSGVSALLEAARLLSRLYRAQHTHPHTNVLFLLAGGGYLNYQGSKRFLEDQLDSSDNSLLGENQPQFVLCLDSLTASDALYLHVSKPPKQGTLLHSFYQRLVEVGLEQGVRVELVHRKINLQDDRQAWEHHKYSIRRLPAATLSAIASPDDEGRGSILDSVSSVNMSRLLRHTSVLTGALLRHIYPASSGGSADDAATEAPSIVPQLPQTLSVSSSSLGSWMSVLSAQPRSTQLLLPAKTNPLVTNLYNILDRYTNEVKVSVHKPDKRDPEYGFHDMTGGTMTAYAIKPASFDLLLSLVIAGYMGLVYLLLQQLPLLHRLLLRSTTAVSNGKLKSKSY
uniref:BOS complex subunit NCLN n=1 Tax=Hirondellea gigas TaxID=1518452 RepID=A0A2P2I1K4_9CRUS